MMEQDVGRDTVTAARNDHDVDAVATLFRGFADPTRLAIVLTLVGGEHRVTDLVDRLGCSQANVSAHIACLKECGLVVGQADGRSVFYRIDRDEVVALLRAAESLLAATGRAVGLCDNYGLDGAKPSALRSDAPTEPTPHG